ncbi:acyl-CoA dehydrogenase family protein [Azospirillum agricola]|uniref:acyl-CoA dehydrogenase family protein n=1 Tax=Azospirillum agricola TaxID=1720247 RepID=UPI000A0EF626|nr:acyl-CoA dehydrogenase family protein [Azospirillum agricola]SMH38701.1 cyclohexanecarboxyl-CoA dehydrogenase [Azospirillum lipoferum]
MDFSFSDEQRMVQDSMRAFARAELLPKYTHWDRNDEFPREQWLKMGALGVLGLRVPVDQGGQEADCVTAGLVIEEIARGDFNCCYGILNSCFAGDILGKFASPAVKDTWLPAMASGETVLCVCLTEPHCGSDAAAIRTQAVRRGDSYVLNGEKSGVTLLMVGDAAIVFAKTDPAAGAKGVSAFLVPLDRPGITRHPYSDMGARGIVRGSLFLEDVEVPAGNLIGPENGGFSRVMQTFDYTRALIGLMCLGAAQATVEETVDYLKQRQAFGRPLSTNQGVSFPLAEWSAKMEMARWFCYRTLWLRDQGLPHTRESAMCKMQVPVIAADAVHDCLILHGHYGYTKDFPVEQRLRDVIGQEIADGTPHIMKIIVARDLFGRDFV